MPIYKSPEDYEVQHGTGDALPTADAAEIERHENMVDEGAKMIHRGLFWLRENNVHLAKGYTRFHDYCKDRFRYSKSRVYQLLSYAEDEQTLLCSGDNVHNCGQIPTSEGVDRPLQQIKTPKEKREAWTEAVKTAPGGNVTGKHVEAVVKKRLKVIDRDNQDCEFPVTRTPQPLPQMVTLSIPVDVPDAAQVAAKSLAAFLDVQLLKRVIIELNKVLNNSQEVGLEPNGKQAEGWRPNTTERGQLTEMHRRLKMHAKGPGEPEIIEALDCLDYLLGL